MAAFEVAKFVNGNVPSGAADKGINLWRAGLLTAPTTTAGNLLGNTTEALTRNAWANPVATGSDILMSLITGKRTKTMAGGLGEGAGEGIDKLKTYLKTGYDERTPGDKFDVREVNYGDSAIGKGAKGYTEAVYRMMSAADQPFYYAARKAALKDIAKAEAINRGLKGAERDNFMRQFVADPPASAVDTAMESAKSAVYQNKTGLGELVSGGKQRLRQYSPTGGAVADFVVPFTQVPASVAMRIVDRMGGGVAKELWKLAPGTKGKFDQRAMAEAIGNGTFGPAMLTVGAELAKQGNLTFGYPEDQKEQELWRMEGKQPYSVKLGDRWYSLNYMQPFGTILAMGGQGKKTLDEGADIASVISQGAATAGQSIMNQSFLKGVSGILDAIDDPKRYAENLWENTAGSVVPNIIRSATRSADPLQRDSAGPLEGLMTGIPGLRDKLPAKTDSFGRPLEAKDNFINQFANPLRPSKVRGDEVVDELRRLQDTDNGILPSRFAKNSLGDDVELDRDQMRQLKEAVGPKVYNAWSSIMSDPRYASMKESDKVKALERAKDKIGEAGKADFAVASGLKSSKEVAKDLSGSARSVLAGKESDWLSSTKTGGSPKERYEAAQAKYDAESKDWSPAERTKKQKALKRMKVQSKYDEDILDLYTMSKGDAYEFIQKAKNGDELAKKLVEYGDALVKSGASAYSKYRNKYGVVSIAPVGSSRRGSSGRSGGSRKRSGTGRGRGRKTAAFKPGADLVAGARKAANSRLASLKTHRASY
jgi:hypothetical protein